MDQKIKRFFLSLETKREQGISLMEVVVATFLFALFALSFITGQGQNVASSQRIKQETRLRDLAELKLNEIILDPPPLSETLTDAVKDLKTFENYPDYQYSVELKKFVLPDFSQIERLQQIQQGQEGQEESFQDENSQENQRSKKIYSLVKENMEKMIWQVGLTVIHKESQEFFKLNTWLYHNKASIRFNAF